MAWRLSSDGYLAKACLLKSDSANKTLNPPVYAQATPRHDPCSYPRDLTLFGLLVFDLTAAWPFGIITLFLHKKKTNIRFRCSTLYAWLSRRNLPVGYVMSILKCWELAHKWYTGRMDHDWQLPDQAQAQQLFDSLGLKGAFWNLGSTD